jgi:hypothetical protein
MKRFTWKHAAAGLALMAVLSLVAPTPAQAAGRGFGEPVAWSGGALAWFASLWDQLAALFRGASGAPPHPTAKTDPAAEGAGISSSPGDLGSTINPDGAPAHP